MPTIVVVPFPPSSPSTPTAVNYELEINRRNTTAYIESDPTDLRFNARERVSDGEGGHVWQDGELLPAQRVRIVTLRSTRGSVERTNVDGEVVQPECMVILEWDAAVEEGWTFMYDEREWEVVFVTDDFNGRYQKHAEVVSR